MSITLNPVEPAVWETVDPVIRRTELLFQWRVNLGGTARSVNDSRPRRVGVLFLLKECKMAEKQEVKYEESDLYRIRHSAAI